MSLYDYQEDCVYHLLNSSLPKECVGLATGGGKTKIFTHFAAMELAKGNGTVIAVNRIELLEQTWKEIKQSFNYSPRLIQAGYKVEASEEPHIYIAMVETLARRKQLLDGLRQRCKTLIVDECHYLQFSKILDGFERVIGFSATPQAMSKKIALSDFYNDLYQAADIQDLIKRGFLLKPLTYAPASLAFSGLEKNLKVTAGEYESEYMGQMLMEEKIFAEVFKAIEQHKRGRTIIYNASVEHSKAVHEALLTKGYESYHVDGSTPKSQRKDILEKLAASPNAIINNVNVLTFGFNEPRVETIIINRLTKSENLFIQMAGRGARLAPDIDKKKFTLLDLYGNCTKFGMWEDSRDWDSKFRNKFEGKAGEAPAKVCPECSAAVPIQSQECHVCGHVFQKEHVKAKAKEDELVLVDKEAINAKVAAIAEQVKLRGQRIYAGLFNLVNYVFENRHGKGDDTIELELMIGLKKWTEEVRAQGHKKRFDDWHKKFVKEKYDERRRNHTMQAC